MDIFFFSALSGTDLQWKKVAIYLRNSSPEKEEAQGEGLPATTRWKRQPLHVLIV